MSNNYKVMYGYKNSPDNRKIRLNILLFWRLPSINISFKYNFLKTSAGADSDYRNVRNVHNLEKFC